MKYILVLCLMFLAGVSSAQYTEVFYGSPGAKGMQSNYGIHTLTPNHVFYSHNVDFWTTPGEIKRRLGLIDYGSNIVPLYGATGHYSGVYGYSMILGVRSDSLDTHRGVFCYSDTSGTSLDNEILASTIYPYKDVYHDWTTLNGVTIHADGMNTPFAFVGESNFKERLELMDKTHFSPKIVSLGAERPGQPRVGIYNDSTTQMRGTFVYAFSYGGDPGPSSAPIKVYDQKVAISHFPFIETGVTNSAAKDTFLFILRQNIIPEEYNRGDDLSSGWYAIDSLAPDSVPSYYLDTLPRIEEGGQWGWDTTWYTTVYVDGGDSFWVDSDCTGDCDDSGTVTYTSCDTCAVLYWGQLAGKDYITNSAYDRFLMGSNFDLDSVTGGYSVWEECIDTMMNTVAWEAEIDWGGNVGFYASHCIYPNYSTGPKALDSALTTGDTTYWYHLDWWSKDTDGSPESTTVISGSTWYMEIAIVGSMYHLETEAELWNLTQSAICGEPVYGLTSSYPAPNDTILTYDSADVGVRWITRHPCNGTLTTEEWIHDYIGWGIGNPDAFAKYAGECYLSYVGCIDSLTPRYDSIKYYYSPSLWYDWDSTGGYRPGQALNPTIDTSTIHPQCQVAYSYYDPILDVESPMSPPVRMRYDSSLMAIDDTLYIPDNKSQGFSWVRVYQTMVDNSIAGATDTTVWYGTMQVRLQSILDTSDIGINKKRLLPMTWADTAVANGLDTADLAGTLDFPYHFFRTALGGVVVRPPSVFDNQVPFSDMDFVSNRLVGIGDPLNPERLYYSDYNTWYTSVFNWNPFDHLDVNEGVAGELIAIERAEGFGRDALYVFKRNGIYLADLGGGETVELVESNIGAVSRRAIVKYGKVIYFLAPDMRIYTLYGPTVKDISDPIADYIDTLFTNEATAATDCRAFRLGKNIKFFDTASGVGLSYNIERDVWSTESYGDDSSYVPRGSFTYDSSNGGLISGFPTTVLFVNDTIPLRIESDTVTYGIGTYGHGFRVQLPYSGDGVNLWSIDKLQLTLRISKPLWLKYAIYNEMQTQLVSDSLYCGTGSIIGPPIVQANYTSNQVLHIGENIGKYLSVVLYSEPNATTGSGNDVDIIDVRTFMRNRGPDNVK